MGGRSPNDRLLSPAPYCCLARYDHIPNNSMISWKDGASMEDLATSDQWQAYVETNLTAPFHLSQAVLPYVCFPPTLVPGLMQKSWTKVSLLFPESIPPLVSDKHRR